MYTAKFTPQQRSKLFRQARNLFRKDLRKELQALSLELTQHFGGVIQTTRGHYEEEVCCVLSPSFLSAAAPLASACCAPKVRAGYFFAFPVTPPPTG